MDVWTARPLIKVENINLSFKAPVLKNVSFEVPHECIYALIGPGAAGKSVLLKTIAGLLTPETGQVREKSTGSSKEPAAPVLWISPGQRKRSVSSRPMALRSLRSESRPTSLPDPQLPP